MRKNRIWAALLAGMLLLCTIACGMPGAVRSDSASEGKATEAGTVLYDGNGIRIIALGRTDDGKDVRLYFENGGERVLNMISADTTVHINGQDVPYGYYIIVPAGMRTVRAMYLSYYIQDLDIASIDSIEFSLNLDYEGGDDVEAVTPPVAVTFE